MTAALCRLALAASGVLWASAARAAEAAASAPAGLQFKPESDAALPGAPQWTLAVLTCVAALALAVWWLRRRGHAMPWAQPAGRLITVLDRTAVSPQVSLVAARYGNRRLLLAVGPAGAQCLRDEPLTDIAPDMQEGG